MWRSAGFDFSPLILWQIGSSLSKNIEARIGFHVENEGIIRELRVGWENERKRAPGIKH